MKEIMWIVIVVLVALISYPIQLYIRIYIGKRKINSALNKIHSQVDLKYNLLKEYIVINKDTIEEEKYSEIESKLSNYVPDKNISASSLRDFNEIYSSYMFSFDDSLLKRTCNESNEEIQNIKNHYNSLVGNYNNYKSNKINSILAKAMFIDDETMF